MGDAPTHWEDAGRLSPPGDTPTDRAVDEASGRWELVIPFFGGGNGRGRFGGGGDVCRLPPEQNCTVHREHTHYGSVYGGGAAPWGAGVSAVVGAGELGPRGDAYGGRGGGDGRGRVGRRVRLRCRDYCSNLIHWDGA